MFKLYRFTMISPSNGKPSNKYLFSYNGQILGISSVECAVENVKTEDKLVQQKFLKMLEQGELKPQGKFRLLPGSAFGEIKIDDYLLKQATMKLRLDEIEKDFE